MFYPSKHTYLQRALCLGYNQRLINRIMDKRMTIASRKDDYEAPKKGHDNSIYNLEPPFSNLDTQIPNIFAPNVDGTRAKKAFGNWALPKLKRQIHYPDIEIVMQALNTILDMVYNPEKAFEAIRIGLVDRLSDMMLHEKDFVREKICMIFFVIAGQQAGRRAIIKRYQILENLFRLAEDEVEAVRHKAHAAIEMISRNLIGAISLNAADCLVLVLRLIGGAPKTTNDDILLLNLSTLEMLLDDHVKVLALKHNALEILLEKINHPKEQIAATALSCIARLCSFPEGRAKADELGLSVLVCKKLYEKSRIVQAKALNAFAYATLASDARIKACNICLVERLLQLFEDFQCSEMQLMAAKALTNLAENPEGRAILGQKKNLKRIKNVYTVGDAEVERHRDILLEVIQWKP